LSDVPWDSDAADPDDPIAETAQQIGKLSPDELLELRAELADLPADDRHAGFDRAALAHFDAMIAAEAESEDGGQA
jgi:hypothetical protein